MDQPLSVYGSGEYQVLLVRDPQPICPQWNAFLTALVSDVESCQRYLARSILWDTAPGDGWTLFASDFSSQLQGELACYVDCFDPESQGYEWPAALERELGQILVWVSQGAVKVRATKQARETLPATSDLLVLIRADHIYWRRRPGITDPEAAVLEQALTNLLGSPPTSLPDLGWLLSAGHSHG